MRSTSAPGVRPSGAAGESLWWIVPGLIGAVAVASSATFLGARIASWLSGHGFDAGPPWRLFGLADLAHTDTIWPAVPPVLVWGCSLALFGLATTTTVVIAVHVRRSLLRPRPPERAMATRHDVARLHTHAAAIASLRLRAELSERYSEAGRVPTRDRGVTVGRHHPSGTVLQASWEDVVLVIAPPRSGKTTSFAVPIVLDAPGPVVACSNKPDLYLTTCGLRTEKPGSEWVFDPQHIVHAPQRWWWNPLDRSDQAMTMDDATRLAGAFVLAVTDDSQREIWGPAATELLSNLTLAASAHARPDARHLMTVYRWLFDEATEEPIQILRDRGHHAAAASLSGLQSLAVETRGSVYFTARSGCASLRDNEIGRWITPQRGLPQFNPTEFVASGDVLYLLSKSARGGTSAAPIVAALTTEIRVAAERTGEQRGGRIDPPLVLVLDEVANICRIADLPEQYSHVGSRSIVPISILQSYAQGERVWGKAGMKELWAAATIKIVGSGVDDAEFADGMSRMIGDHEVNVLSYTRGRGVPSSTLATRRDAILPSAELRALPRDRAVLLATGLRPAMIRLLPWYAGPLKKLIAAKLRLNSEALQARASIGREDHEPPR